MLSERTNSSYIIMNYELYYFIILAINVAKNVISNPITRLRLDTLPTIILNKQHS